MIKTEVVVFELTKNFSKDSRRSILKVYTRIKSKYDSLTISEQQIADFILFSFEKIQHLTLFDIAVATSKGQATIIRLCKKLGFNGFTELKYKIALEQNDQKKHVFPLAEESTEKINVSITKINQRIDKNQFERAIQHMNNAQRVYIFGIGSLSASALDLEYYFLKYFNIKAIISENDQEIYASLITERDLIIVLASSDNYSSILIAKKSKAQIIIISNSVYPISFSANVLYLLGNSANEEDYPPNLLLDKIIYMFIVNIFVDFFEESISKNSMIIATDTSEIYGKTGRELVHVSNKNK